MKTKVTILAMCWVGVFSLSHVSDGATNLPTIYHWDMRFTSTMSSTDRYDYRHMAVSVQGIVNRQAPRIFLSFTNDDLVWLGRLTEPGGLCEGWNVVAISNVVDYLTRFKSSINGLVVYDTGPAAGVISTSLAATTAAAVENAIAIRKDTSSVLYNYLTTTASGPKFPLLIDLTGKFTGSGTIWQTATASTGSAKCDAYIWAKEKYLDSGLSNPRVLSYTLDLFGLQNTVDLQSELTNLDYALMQKGFCFELSPWGDEIPNDDPGQPLGTDLNTFKTILNACNIQTGQNSMIKFTGFSNWDFKYTSVVGGLHGGVPTEDELIHLVTAYNVYAEADAPDPRYVSNTSFYAGLKPAIEQRRYVQNPAPSYAQLQAQGLIDGSGNVPWGNYIMIYMGDYDQSSWTLNELYKKYDDANRGNVHCNWALSPNNSDRVGVVFDYVYRHKSSKDFFVAGTSGAGYIHPSQLRGSRSPSGYPSAVNLWQAHSRNYYRLFDYSISGWLLNGTNNGWQNLLTVTDVQTYLPFSGDGIGLQASSQTSDQFLQSNIPVKERLGPDNPSTLSDISNASTGINFAWYRTILETPSQVLSLEQSTAGSGNNHRFLDAYTFYYLLRYHLGGNNNHRATWISDTIPRIMAAGQTYPVTVTVRNDGWDTWSESGLYRLGHAIVAPGVIPATGDYNVNGRHAIAGGATVATSAQVVFSFNIQAPAVNGNYALYYDMVHDGVAWFHQQNNIEWKKSIIVATNETDVDTDGDGFSDVGEQACGTLYWHPDDDATCCVSPLADLDGNCRVDIEDHAVLAQEWLSNGLNLSFPVGTVWDLKNNWSDTGNPTGPWSYRGANESLFNVHTVPYSPGDFDPSQPGWKSVMYPFWVGMAKMIINGSGAPAGRKFDYLAGDVLGHANWKVRWTSPGSMTVRVSGDVWRIRNSDVLHASLSENGSQGLHDIGDIPAANGRNNRITYNYTFGVVPGQVVTLFMSGNDYGAVNMTVAVVDNCIKPVSDLDNDCDVDFADLLILVQDWLGCGLFYQINCF